MSENRDSRITDAMVDAARAAWINHGTTIREVEDGRWHWFCTCGGGRDEVDALRVEDDAYEEMQAHEFGAVVQAALAADPRELIGSWPQWWCRACGNRYAEHVDVDLCSCDGQLQAVTLQLVAREA